MCRLRMAEASASQPILFQPPSLKTGPDKDGKANVNVEAGGLSNEEVERIAFRISLNTWSALATESKTMNEVDLLRKYILLCPYLSPESHVVQAALSGLLAPSTTMLYAPKAIIIPQIHPPPHSPPDIVDLRSEENEHFEEHSDHESSDETNDSAKMQSMITPTKLLGRHRASRRSRVVGTLMRSLCFDFPLILLLATYWSLVWLHRVHDVYLVPQMEAVVWTDARADEEITYYRRSCRAEDISTHDPSELFLPMDVSPEVAYHHQLKHGFSVFPQALSRDMATKLRDMIVVRNHNLTEAEAIYVINNQNRNSFGLDTREPVVAKAMQELTSHPPLFAAVEKIMGPAPALIEMTAITSSYGATDQWWHDDVVYGSSPVQFARTFGPSYSVFVVLQDTTRDMGATGACPGSHMCADGPIAEFCEAEGYQLVGNDGYWATGDALLMNMDSWHRGAAHRDPNALDRVMLILTWVPRPQGKAESRQMAQGITFSLRWDHWGMTWRDLRAGRFHFPPWLRSLALFKPSNAVWGLDYISSSSMRMANQDNGFRRDELDTFIERDGGIWYLPKFLHGVVNEDESWHEYFLYTLVNCESFILKGFVASTGAYVLFFMLTSYVFVEAPQRQGDVAGPIRRVMAFHGLVFALFLLASYYVDHTLWAKDISKNLRYSNAFVEEEPIYSLDAPTTFPHRRDVLVATRYSSEWLHMYNDWFDNHPGNGLLDRLVRSAADTYKTHHASEDNIFSHATVQYILDAIAMDHGRFLHQSTHGTWRLMSNEDAAAYVQTELHYKANPFLAKLKRVIGFIQSDYRYGEHRSTVLAKKVSLSYLQDLQHKLILSATTLSSKSDRSNISGHRIMPLGERNILRRHLVPRPLVMAASISKAKIKTTVPGRIANRKQSVVTVTGATPPYSNAWMKSGDLVEVRLLEEEGIPLWYLGRLVHVTASGKYTVEFFDDSAPLDSPQEDLRPYTTLYYEGERVGILDEEREQYVGGRIVLQRHSSSNGNGNDDVLDTYDVQLQSRQVLHNVHPGMFRRYQ